MMPCSRRTVGLPPVGITCLHLFLLVLLFTAGAEAAPGSARRAAAKLNEQGFELVKSKQYLKAITKFKQGHALFPDPTFLLNIGRCHAFTGDQGKACVSFQRYSSALPDTERSAFAADLAKLCPCTFVLQTKPGGARVKIDGKDRGNSRQDGALELTVLCATGNRVVEVDHHGYLSQRQLHAPPAPGGRKELQIALEPVATSPPAPQPDVIAPPTPAPTEATPPTEPPTKPEPAEATDQPEQGAPASSGYFLIHLFAGPSWADYGDPRLSAEAAMEFGLRVGYMFRRPAPWLALSVEAMVFAVPVADEPADESHLSWFVSYLGGAGIRFYLLHASGSALARELWTGIGFHLGASTLAGASKQSLFFQWSNLATVEGGFTVLAFRPEFHIGWNPWRGVSVVLTPLAVDWSQPIEDFSPNIEQVLRFHWSLQVGWQL